MVSRFTLPLHFISQAMTTSQHVLFDVVAPCLQKPVYIYGAVYCTVYSIQCPSPLTLCLIRTSCTGNINSSQSIVNIWKEKTREVHTLYTFTHFLLEAGGGGKDVGPTNFFYKFEGKTIHLQYRLYCKKTVAGFLQLNFFSCCGSGFSILIQILFSCNKSHLRQQIVEWSSCHIHCKCSYVLVVPFLTKLTQTIMRHFKGEVLSDIHHHSFFALHESFQTDIPRASRNN